MPTIKKKNNPIYQAQAILSVRDHSESEVRQKLRRKGFVPEQIEEAITWLYEQKLLNDTEFARRYAASLVATKPVGPRWVRAKLKQRGIAEQEIESTIANVFSEHTEAVLAQEAAASWRRLHTQEKKAHEKLYRHLASRGFSPDVIAIVTK